MIKFLRKNSYGFLLLTFLWSACDDDDAQEFPTSTQISYSLVGRQAAFAALANSTTSYQWDFGDGAKSTERNPVHIYTGAGFYTVTLKVDGTTGSAADTVELAVDITPYVLLTGGATDTDGKTWKMDNAHSKFDKFAKADEKLTSEINLTPGILGNIGLAEVYEDEFTFFYDGGYKHDVKADKASFAALVNQLMLNGGADIVSLGNGADEYGLCTAKYTPETNATFAYNQGKDYAVPSIYGGGVSTYEDVNTFTFSGTEFIGLLDANREVIVQEITNTSMRLVIFVNASPGSYPKATHALVATFKAI